MPNETKQLGPNANPKCPACISRRTHIAAEWTEYHPFAGHGRQEHQPWTHPDLEAEAQAKREAVNV